MKTFSAGFIGYSDQNKESCVVWSRVRVRQHCEVCGITRESKNHEGSKTSMLPIASLFHVYIKKVINELNIRQEMD